MWWGRRIQSSKCCLLRRLMSTWLLSVNETELVMWNHHAAETKAPKVNPLFPVLCGFVHFAFERTWKHIHTLYDFSTFYYKLRVTELGKIALFQLMKLHKNFLLIGIESHMHMTSGQVPHGPPMIGWHDLCSIFVHIYDSIHGNCKKSLNCPW